MDIKKIIKIFDDELIDNNKGYLTLGQANKLLVDNGIITIFEKSNNVLKKLLEKNEIPHATQTDKKPKQWRIPLSDEGEKKLLKIQEEKEKNKKPRKEPRQKIKEKGTCPQCGTETIFGSHCKECGNYLTIPKKVIFNENIESLIEQNHLQKDKPKQPTQNEVILTKNQRNWIIGIAIVGFLWLIGTFSDNDSSTTTLYKVNTTTYVGTSKANYDEMFNYLSTSDMQALSSLMLKGQVELLTSGTEVYLLNAHFGYAVVRINGSTQKLWIVTDHITKE
tara:strand:+ start:134 stop:967 length:834 start_codon:yes stop_codon:yes gene_type:complete